MNSPSRMGSSEAIHRVSVFMSSTALLGLCRNGGDCVGIARTPTLIGVRDTKNRDGATLTFSP